MGEIVQIAHSRQMAEVVALKDTSPPTAIAQVYGSTAGMRPGTRVRGTGAPLSVTLHEGLPGSIYDPLLNRLGKPAKPQGKHAITHPIRTPRPVQEKLPPTIPLITGQRIIDSFFPLAKGGTAMIPGGFGTGKTSLQHQLARHADVDIVVYIGCGERGNEMTEVLHEFADLLPRMIIIAATSDMPVAMREASIYTGITAAEFFRDKGKHVALMADSTSRWAEALRELAARQAIPPAEEGYPPYLAARLAAFYGRAGHVRIGGTQGSITIIGAVSPPGGDFTEPVTTHTRRFTGAYWALDARLAHARHYPAICPYSSYSSYGHTLPQFAQHRKNALQILTEAREIKELGAIAGIEALTASQQSILATAAAIGDYTRQNAHDPQDTFTPPASQLERLTYVLQA
jgi:V/A-type H+-transporting ATPase subunit A